MLFYIFILLYFNFLYIILYFIFIYFIFNKSQAGLLSKKNIYTHVNYFLVFCAAKIYIITL